MENASRKTNDISADQIDFISVDPAEMDNILRIANDISADEIGIISTGPAEMDNVVPGMPNTYQTYEIPPLSKPNYPPRQPHR